MATREFQRQQVVVSSAVKRGTRRKNAKLLEEEKIPSTIRTGRNIKESVKRQKRQQESLKEEGRNILKALRKKLIKMLGEDLSFQKTKAKARANMLKPHGHQHSAVPTIFQTGESDWTAGQMSTCSM